MNYTHHFVSGARIANFSDIPLNATYQITFPNDDADACIRILRMHADLPYVFLVGRRTDLVKTVLDRLKALRSACFPHAVFALEDGIPEHPDLDVIDCKGFGAKALAEKIAAYAAEKFSFDPDVLKVKNRSALPEQTDVFIVGAGITGLYAANRLTAQGMSVCVADKRSEIGGIWSRYANASSRVNTSEAAYRLIEKQTRTNRDHSATREILEDMAVLGHSLKDRIFLDTEVVQIEKAAAGYLIRLERGGQASTVASRGVILAINDRVGDAREIAFANQAAFKGRIVKGFSDGTKAVDWKDKKVIVVGMGAFAIENARTALEFGAAHVTLVCRRHGTVCPKIIDYLNFATPYDENFKHDSKSNFRNMMYWKKLYDLSGATQPECWMGKLKHTGHTVSVSDIWFVGHHLKKISTVTGEITSLTENGVMVNRDQALEADIIVNCIGFERNGAAASSLCNYTRMYSNNYVDKNFMYLADAYIDDDAFNSFFGSSVLEMVKFYMEVFLKYFDHPDHEKMMGFDGIEKIAMDNRKWSHYIRAAKSLIDNDPELYEAAKKQVARRTENFLEKHDLETYIRENRREWIDLHTFLAGRPLKDEERLPYVFEKLL